MNKTEFIGFLKAKAMELKDSSHWKQSFDDCDDHWTLYRPSVDWLEDGMEIIDDENIKITYVESFYDDPKHLIMTYQEFVENYSQSVSYN